MLTPAHRRFTFRSARDVGASLQAADLELLNQTTNQLIPAGDISLNYDANSNTATFTFPNFGYGTLPDANYTATIHAANVTDPAGNALTQDVSFNFSFLNGDANHDGHVNLLDFNIVAGNFNQSNRTFSQGDFNYDGQVNLLDFNILAARFNSALSAPASRPPTLPLFSDSLLGVKGTKRLGDPLVASLLE